MKKNMGTVDRALRTIVAAVILLLILTGAIAGTPATVLGIVAVVFLLTSAVGVCPAYLPFGLSTGKRASGA
ncbi:MAG TPA: DUF2892 domain-containing protein [Longimicrobiales bacterium]|nr:DUF2892 domain-containing protein [Longimicrobiales bacterium]